MRRFLTRWSAVVVMVVPLLTLVFSLTAPGAALAQTAAQPTPTELTYFADTAPFRAHLGQNQQWLEAMLEAVQTGRGDEVSTDEISNLTRELFAAQRGFARAVPSARLVDYDRAVQASVDRAYTAAVLLLHAQVTDSGPEHDAQVRDAAMYAHSSGKLLQEAADALAQTSLVAQ